MHCPDAPGCDMKKRNADLQPEPKMASAQCQAIWYSRITRGVLYEGVQGSYLVVDAAKLTRYLGTLRVDDSILSRARPDLYPRHHGAVS